VHEELRLAGLVRVEPNNELQIRNEIYRSVFDRRWANDLRPKSWTRFAVTATFMILIGALIHYRWVYVPELLNRDRARRDFERASTVREVERAYLTATLDDKLGETECISMKSAAIERLARQYETEANRRLGRGESDEAILMAALAARVRGVGLSRAFDAWVRPPCNATTCAESYDRLLLTLRGHREHVRSAIHHPTKPRIASVGGDGALSWWNAETGLRVWSSSVAAPIQLATMSRDGQTLTALHEVCPTRGTVTLWDADDRVPSTKRTPIGFDMPVCWATALNEQMLFAVGDQAEVMDATTHRTTKILGVSGIALSALAPKGDLAAVAQDPNAQWHIRSAVRVLDVRQQKFEAVQEIMPDSIIGLSWDGDRILAATAREVRVWSPAATGQKPKTLWTSTRGDVVAIDVCGHSLLIGTRTSSSGEVMVDDTSADPIQARSFIQWPRAALERASFAPGCERIVSGWSDGTIRIFGARAPDAARDPWTEWQRRLGLTIVGGVITPLARVKEYQRYDEIPTSSVAEQPGNAARE
jgi:hypothetical protein